jgi:hypothetical protein
MGSRRGALEATRNRQKNGLKLGDIARMKRAKGNIPKTGHSAWLELRPD